MDIHFPWEIEFLKNISTINLLLYSTMNVSSLSFCVRSNKLCCELSEKEIKNIELDQFKIKSLETKQWPDHLQVKIILYPHNDKQYSFIQERWCEKLPQVSEFQNLFCKFCHQCLTPERDNNFKKVQQLPGAHWEEIKDSFWVCACNATALEQSTSIPKGFIRAQPGKVLLSNSFALIHGDDLSFESIDYLEKDKELLKKIEQSQSNFVPKYKSNEYETKIQQWIEVLCSQCMIPIGLKEISCGEEFKYTDNNFKLWKHKTITNVVDGLNHWKYRTIESMLSSDMVSCMTTHGSYRFHLKNGEMLIAQIVVTNWSTFRTSGEDFGSDSISLKSIRPIIKFSFRDCYSNPDLTEKFENQWLTKYQIETIYYSLSDCFELLTNFHKNNKKLSPMCREFSGMLNSWIYYLIDS